MRGTIDVTGDTATPGPVVTSAAGLVGTFPDDGCGVYGIPVAADQPLPAFDGESANEVLGGWNATLRDALPIGAMRRDWQPSGERCAEVDLSFSIGSAEHVCYSSASVVGNWRGGFSFSSDTSRMKSADGLLDMRLDGFLAQPSELSFANREDRVVTDQVASQTGIGGLESTESDALEYFADFYFSRSPGADLASGALFVSGVCDVPSSEGACGREVMSLKWPAGLYDDCPL
jgi:hypothetical protein